jgi:hypothetical protein
MVETLIRTAVGESCSAGSVIDVTTAGAFDRLLAARHGLTSPIALQTGWEVSRQCQMAGASLACPLDEQGRVANPVAIGGDAILALATRPAALADPPRAKPTPRSQRAPDANGAPYRPA